MAEVAPDWETAVTHESVVFYDSGDPPAWLGESRIGSLAGLPVQGVHSSQFATV